MIKIRLNKKVDKLKKEFKQRSDRNVEWEKRFEKMKGKFINLEVKKGEVREKIGVHPNTNQCCRPRPLALAESRSKSKHKGLRNHSK